MWIALSLVAAVGSAGTGLALKRALAFGPPLASTVSFRALAGVLLLGAAVVAGPWPALGADYWRVVAVALPFEVVGTVAFTLALRSGDVSLVQPLFGLIPLVVTLGGAVLLGERPTAGALAGVGLVAAGVYGIGLDGTRGVGAPLRALARDPSSRWAGVAMLAWSVTAVLHKVGIAASGPMPWAVTLALGSAVGLAVITPTLPAPLRSAPGAGSDLVRWTAWVGAAGALFAVQQVGLQSALGLAPAGYVTAVSATSIVLSVTGGVVLLGERGAARQRLAGGSAVAFGAALVALFG